VYVRTGHTPEQDSRRFLVPALAVRADDFNRLRGLAKKSTPVTLRTTINVVEEPGRPDTGFNVLADIVGVEQAAELVVLGAHLDSIHVAQGATDNAAGCGTIIEAARLITAAGVRPGRTIRIALWGGEEQGRRGSKAYVRDHLLDLETDTRKPEFDRTVVYFNVDRGSGRIRGVFLEGNESAYAHVGRWRLELGTPNLFAIDPTATRGSDHLSFREVGVPVLTFMQEPLSYAMTHHSTGDVVAEVREDHLRQAASAVASVVYLAASDERLPQGK
jgi:carboxypeptidase Q